MIVAALLFFQHVLVPDMPTVDKNPFTSAEDLEQGEKLYGARCAGCHGPAGDGGKGTNLATPALPRAGTDLGLYRIIRHGLPETEMPAHNMTQREIWQIAAYVRKLGRAGEGGVNGNAGNGEALIRGKGNCLQCHVLNGEGGHLGPPLSDMGRRRSPAYLRTKLVDPGKDVASDFAMVTLKTRSGGTVTGLRLNEDTWSIQVRDAKLGLHSFWKRDLAEVKVDSRTPMPSYARQLSEQEIQDVVAFLASAGVRQ